MLKKLLSSFAFATLIAFVHSGIVANSYAAEIAPKTSNERGIKVTAMLQAVPADAKTWNFEVTLETHTQALSDDMARSATLIVDGKRYLTLDWAGVPPGGHHRKGVLRFQATGPQPRSMELQIRLTGDTSPRSFKWLLN